jgi:hypothetical protein
MDVKLPAANGSFSDRGLFSQSGTGLNYTSKSWRLPKRHSAESAPEWMNLARRASAPGSPAARFVRPRGKWNRKSRRTRKGQWCLTGQDDAFDLKAKLAEVAQQAEMQPAASKMTESQIGGTRAPKRFHRPSQGFQFPARAAPSARSQ